MVILISAVLVTINPMEQIRKSQDSRRKNDLAQLQRVLENYYTDYGRYPEASGTSIAPKGVLKDWGTNWSPYIDLIPKDPSGDKTYAYWVDGSGQTYRIYTSLDRGAFDPQACTGANNLCSNADTSQGIYCSVDHGNASIVCNYGVTSSNTSP